MKNMLSGEKQITAAVSHYNKDRVDFSVKCAKINTVNKF